MCMYKMSVYNDILKCKVNIYCILMKWFKLLRNFIYNPIINIFIEFIM